MVEDDAILLEDIQTLLAAKPGEPGLAAIEDTLASGYARAMALEAERWRLERRLGELARGIADGRESTDELAQLARRMSTADGDLSTLRTALGSLRDRAREIRFASA